MDINNQCVGAKKDTSSACATYPGDEEEIVKIVVKVEDDHTNQWEDEIAPHDTNAVVVKSEYEDMSYYLQQMDKEIFDAPNLEETNEQVSNQIVCDHISFDEDQIEHQGHFLAGQEQYECQFCDYVKRTNILENNAESVGSDRNDDGTQKSQLEIQMDSVRMNLKRLGCNLSDYTENWENVIKEHIYYSQSNIKRRKCHFCDVAGQKGNPKDQSESVRLNSTNRKCEFCEFTAKRKEEPKNQAEIDSNPKQFKCHLCEYSSDRKCNVTKHVDSKHLNLKQYKCELCCYSANQNEDLKKHIHCVHFNAREHKCHMCDYAANRKLYLKNHINSVHLNLKQHKCHLCEYSTSRKDQLRKHIDIVHLNLKKHKCEFCDYAANQKGYLKSHIDAVHMNLKQHKCGSCDYCSNRKDRLKKHIEIVHGNFRKHKCHLCDYSANLKCNLKKHIYSIHTKLKQK